LVATGRSGNAEGGKVSTTAGLELAGGVGTHGVWDSSQLEAWGHLTVVGDGTSARGASNVHGEVELLVPWDGTREGCQAAKVDTDVAVDDTDTAVIAAHWARAATSARVVGTGLCPESTATSGSAVELEVDVVVAIRDDSAPSSLEASLEVEVVGSSG
jgi:hypothetical protein